jgi:hypothetical protein
MKVLSKILFTIGRALIESAKILQRLNQKLYAIAAWLKGEI